MANGAAAAPAGGGGAAVAGGGNPFQLATNLYAEKNQQGSTTNLTVGASQTTGGGAVNAGQYLRAVRLVFRTSTAGTVATAGTTSDMPWNILTGVDLVNVDGSEILYSMGGFAHYLVQKYGRPWLGDPGTYQDAANSTVLVPQFTLTLQPEIRWTAGVLANTDTRSQYRFDYAVDTATNFLQGGTAYTVFPVVNVTPYMDAWAQPDSTDLQGTPNQPVPPGLNLQNKRRHQISQLNAAGSDNIIQSALTGNALRLQLLVTRGGSPALRQDIFTDPFTWQIDNRSMGKYSTNAKIVSGTATSNLGGDYLGLRDAEFYSEYFNTQQGNGGGVSTSYLPYARETGVYAFPRFIKPGSLFGESWLYTANSTKEIFESTSASGTGTSPTWELITDEMYPVGQVDPSLTDI
ncbi:MAG: hypothetical protein M0030_04515 [Actinomycetota bacterium]|nr:hypothetical protein [Actinomycetota bacterium]